MDIERETRLQIALSVVAVALFVAAAAAVSTTYGTGGNLTATGGRMLVATIGLFVVAMLAAGLWLERQEF